MHVEDVVQPPVGMAAMLVPGVLAIPGFPVNGAKLNMRVKDTEPAPDHRGALARDIVGKTQARRPILIVGFDPGTAYARLTLLNHT